MITSTCSNLPKSVCMHAKQARMKYCGCIKVYRPWAESISHAACWLFNSRLHFNTSCRYVCQWWEDGMSWRWGFLATIIQHRYVKTVALGDSLLILAAVISMTSLTVMAATDVTATSSTVWEPLAAVGETVHTLVIGSLILMKMMNRSTLIRA